MAQTEHLPIYKATYDLCLYLEQIVQHFSRYHKYALGADLRDGARRTLKRVVRAKARRDTTPVLLQLREELEALQVLLRLGQDVQAFPNCKSLNPHVLLSKRFPICHDAPLVLISATLCPRLRINAKSRGLPSPRWRLMITTFFSLEAWAPWC